MLNKPDSSKVVHMKMNIPVGLTGDVDSGGTDDPDTTGAGNVTLLGFTE